MNEAKDFEDAGGLGHPRNQLYAIIKDAESALRAARELNYVGIKSADIELLIGKEDATKLDAATGKHSFLAKAVRIGLELGDRDSDYLAYYRGALMQDYAVIAVVTHHHDSRGKVRALLKTYGAYAMTNFDQFATEVWEG
jgi:hypothetical protein